MVPSAATRVPSRPSQRYVSCRTEVVLSARPAGWGSARALGWACVAFFLAVTKSAVAADPKVQLVGEGSLGYTDNVQSSPSEPVPGIAPKEGGAFAVLRPGAVLALTTPRIMHRVSYAFTYNLFFVASQSNNTANRLEYLGFYDLSPFTTLLLGGGLTESNPDTATTLGGTALLPGSTAFVAGTADALLSHELAPSWRTWLGASGLGHTPLFETVAPRT